MLKPIWFQSSCDRLVPTRPVKIDRRAAWTSLRFEGQLPVVEAPQDHALDILTAVRSDASEGAPGLVENHGHAWIRMVRPDGTYASVGFFPDESTGVEPDERPGLRLPGMLLMPDKYDQVEWDLRSVRVPLSADGFAEIRSYLEAMQAARTEGALQFDLVDRSCVGFVVRVAALAGAQVEAETPILDFLLARPLLSRPGLGWLGAILNMRIVLWIRLRLRNLGLYILGGRVALGSQWVRTDGGEAILQQITGIEPLFATCSEIIKRPVPFYHVRGLRLWQERVAREGLVGARPENDGQAQPPQRTDTDAADAGGQRHQPVVS